MAHAIDMSNGRANMAYAKGRRYEFANSGDISKPWHGLGFAIDPDASIDDWRRAAGLDWEIRKGELRYETDDGELLEGGDLRRSVLYRSDTKAPLSIMSTDGYHVVQPADILQFIGEAVEAMGWKMETAGSLNGGRKIWALANIGEQYTLPGGDTVKGYLMAATACDGSMASDFGFTTIQVVCDNTLQIAHHKKEGQPRVKAYHYCALDIAAVKRDLGIAGNAWGGFIEHAKRLAATRLTRDTAIQVLRKVYARPADDSGANPVIEGTAVRVSDEQFIQESMYARRILQLYEGAGIGAQLASQAGTAWGLVSACTEFYDRHSIARTADNRLNSAWFGGGASKKQEIFDACLELA